MLLHLITCNYKWKYDISRQYAAIVTKRYSIVSNKTIHSHTWCNVKCTGDAVWAVKQSPRVSKMFHQDPTASSINSQPPFVKNSNSNSTYRRLRWIIEWSDQVASSFQFNFLLHRILAVKGENREYLREWLTIRGAASFCGHAISFQEIRFSIRLRPRRGTSPINFRRWHHRRHLQQFCEFPGVSPHSKLVCARIVRLRFTIVSLTIIIAKNITTSGYWYVNVVVVVRIRFFKLQIFYFWHKNVTFSHK